MGVPLLGAGSFLSPPFASLARLALLLLFSVPFAPIFRSCTRVLYTVALLQVGLQRVASYGVGLLKLVEPVAGLPLQSAPRALGQGRASSALRPG